MSTLYIVLTGGGVVLALVLGLAWAYARTKGKAALGKQAQKDLKRWGEEVEKSNKRRSQPLDIFSLGAGWRKLRGKNSNR